MTRPFGHEKLIVYQKAMRFVAIRSALISQLPRQVAACDHLHRGAESILVNIARSNSTWSPTERIVYLGHANGSALECAACLDVFVAKHLLTTDDVAPGKCLLSEVVSMLIAMHKTAANRISEDHAPYRTQKGRMFNHEDLDVYQKSLDLIAWLEPMMTAFSCTADLRMKLDKSTTSIVLNIAEGNGRFTGADQAHFYEIAYKATRQSAALIDLAATQDVTSIDQGRELLSRIATMLTALSAVVSQN